MHQATAAKAAGSAWAEHVVRVGGLGQLRSELDGTVANAHTQLCDWLTAA